MRDIAVAFKPHAWVNVHSGMEGLFMPYDHVANIPEGPDADASLAILQVLDMVPSWLGLHKDLLVRDPAHGPELDPHCHHSVDAAPVTLSRAHLCGANAGAESDSMQRALRRWVGRQISRVLPSVTLARLLSQSPEDPEPSAASKAVL